MPEDIKVIDALRSMKFDADPTDEFTSRLRTRLLAVASVDAPQPRRVGVGAGFLDALRRLVGSSRTIAAMTTLSIVLACSGLLVIAGRAALPGDTLYGVKRASEQVQLAFAGSPSEAAFTRLGFAQERLAEINELLGSPVAMSVGSGPIADGGDSAKISALINETLDAMDRDTRAGTKVLVTQATAAGNKVPLATLQAWSGQQLSILNQLTPRLPSSSVKRAASSGELLVKVDDRVVALLAELDSDCLKTTPDDFLGPKPCAGEFNPNPSATISAPNPVPPTPAPATPSPNAPAPPAGSSTTSPDPGSGGGGADPGAGGGGAGGGGGGGGGAGGGGQTANPNPDPDPATTTKPAPPPAQLPEPAPTTTTPPPPEPEENCIINLLGICIAIPG